MDKPLLQRLQSHRHSLSFHLSRVLRWSRGEFREEPAGELPGLETADAAEAGRLRSEYGVDFAATLSAVTARNSYAYLAALDRTYAAMGVQPPSGCTVVDLGSANFWYAAALHAFFRPRRLVGIEIDGFRRYRNGHTRSDYAQGYVRSLAGAEFRVADQADLDLPADVLTAWFPFVTPEPLLAWRLPLSMLRPPALFASVRRNLRPSGRFLMANQDNGEFAAATAQATAAGLCQQHVLGLDLSLVQRTQPVVLSVWS